MKIDNKGFTLIELLAVMIILISISLVAVGGITESLQNRDIKECKEQQELAISAAKIYFSLNDVTCVTIGELNSSDPSKVDYFKDDKKIDRLKETGVIYFSDAEYVYNESGSCKIVEDNNVNSDDDDVSNCDKDDTHAYAVYNYKGELVDCADSLGDAIEIDGFLTKALKDNRSGSVTITNDINLNTNGKKITIDGTITINTLNVSIDGYGKIVSTNDNQSVIEHKGDGLSLRNVTIINTGECIDIKFGSNITINEGVKLESTQSIALKNAGKAYIYGGTMKSTQSIALENAGNAYIYGGTMEGYQHTLYNDANAELTIGGDNMLENIKITSSDPSGNPIYVAASSKCTITPHSSNPNYSVRTEVSGTGSALVNNGTTTVGLSDQKDEETNSHGKVIFASKSGYAIENTGTLTYKSNAISYSGSAQGVKNTGTINLQGGRIYYNDSTSTSAFVNTGTINKSSNNWVGNVSSGEYKLLDGSTISYAIYSYRYN